MGPKNTFPGRFEPSQALLTIIICCQLTHRIKFLRNLEKIPMSLLDPLCSASDQQMPSCMLIGINLDTEPPSQFMSGKTWTCNDGLGEGAKACILPLGSGYCNNKLRGFTGDQAKKTRPEVYSWPLNTKIRKKRLKVGPYHLRGFNS